MPLTRPALPLIALFALQGVAWTHAKELVDCINPMIGAITLGGYGGQIGRAHV